ncbi:MAG: hypothetical protein HC767_01020 [Akkermansiaceae bacterium]|nr:hypothetical protein [Akkermansiaceae bacterium]
MMKFGGTSVANVERIQKVLSADNLLFGIAGGFGAEIVAPGHVHHNGMEAINLAELDGGISARLERVAEVRHLPVEDRVDLGQDVERADPAQVPARVSREHREVESGRC